MAGEERWASREELDEIVQEKGVRHEGSEDFKSLSVLLDSKEQAPIAQRPSPTTFRMLVEESQLSDLERKALITRAQKILGLIKDEK
jgi:hypothetical protein